MARTIFSSLLLVALWLVASLSGCVTKKDLSALKQELQQDVAQRTAPIEPLRAETNSTVAKLSLSLKEQGDQLREISRELSGLRDKVRAVEARSENIAAEREKVHAALQSASRRILLLFKTEEEELKDRLRFLQGVIKDYGEEGSSKK
jgi:chromosome segregation ATPase